VRFKKVYGASKVDKCPFCGKTATTENLQGVPVCLAHKTKSIDLKCVCGEWLDIKKGKFGAFAVCINCGAMSLTKALSMNPQINSDNASTTAMKDISSDNCIDKNKSSSFKNQNSFTNESKNAKNIIVTSNELDFMYD